MTLSEFLQLAALPIVFLASYLYLKPQFVEWSEPERGFQPLENSWKKIFLYGGIAATIVAAVVLLVSDLNNITATALGVTSGYLMMSAYTDNFLGKVPQQLSSLAIYVSLFLGLGALIINGFNIYGASQKVYDTPPVYLPGDWYLWAGGGLAVGLLTFLIWYRISGIIGLVSLLITAGGLWVASYATLREFSNWLNTTNFVSFMPPEGIASVLVYGLPSMLAILLVTVAFQLGSDGKMGDADPAAIYAVAWGFGAVIGGVAVGIGVIVACLVQLVLHLIVNVFKLGGKVKTVRYDPILSLLRKIWWKITRKEGTPSPTYQATAVPFLPILNMTAISTMIVFVMFSPSFV